MALRSAATTLIAFSRIPQPDAAVRLSREFRLVNRVTYYAESRAIIRLCRRKNS